MKIIFNSFLIFNIVLLGISFNAKAKCAFNCKKIEIKFKKDDIYFPKYFFAKKINPQCKMEGKNHLLQFKDKDSNKFLREFVNYNWTEDHDKRSDSLYVFLEEISDRLNLIYGATINSMINNTYDEEAILGGEILTLWAESNVMMDTINTPEIMALKKGTPGRRCYDGVGKVKAKCTWHTAQEAARYAGQFIINAILLKKKLSPVQIKIINTYIQNLYTRHVSTWAKNARKKGLGFYQMADGGISVLAYAHWMNDKKIAKEEFSIGFNEINSVWYNDGYINNNSFRGVKDIFYHTLGLNNALGYIALAQEWDVKIPSKIQEKINNSVLVHKLGVEDLEKYRKRKFDGYLGNATFDKKHAREHTHHEATFIDWLELNYTNINDVKFLDKDAMWHYRKGRKFTDRMLGFNPKCIKK